MSPLLDTHIWIWWVLGQAELSRERVERLDNLARQGKPPFLSAISLWEAQMLHHKKRLQTESGLATWLPLAADPMIVRILPIDVSVVLAVDKLPRSFHGDPADRIIVATAMAHGLPVVTDDKAMRRSRLVKPAFQD